MVVLRAGLCPGLTEEMIQLLRARSIRTGNGAAAGSRGGECHSLHIWGGTMLPCRTHLPGWVVWTVEQPLENISCLCGFGWQPRNCSGESFLRAP